MTTEMEERSWTVANWDGDLRRANCLFQLVFEERLIEGADVRGCGKRHGKLVGKRACRGIRGLGNGLFPRG